MGHRWWGNGRWRVAPVLWCFSFADPVWATHASQMVSKATLLDSKSIRLCLLPFCAVVCTCARVRVHTFARVHVCTRAYVCVSDTKLKLHGGGEQGSVNCELCVTVKGELYLFGISFCGQIILIYVTWLDFMDSLVNDVKFSPNVLLVQVHKDCSTKYVLSKETAETVIGA